MVLARQLADAINGSDGLSPAKQDELAGQLRAQPGYRWFLRTTPGGLLRIDRTAVRREERFDGKFLLRTSDPTTLSKSTL